jgi:16S rRNA C1402 (ribose-2'-O) methylase RsmI
MSAVIAETCLGGMVGKNSFTAFGGSNAAKLKLMSTGTTDESGDGTEINGGSYPTGGIGFAPTSTWGSPGFSAGVASITNSGAAITQAGMPAVASPGVAYASIWDTAGTPVRWWWGQLTTAQVTNSGDTLTFATSSIACQIAI